MPDALDSLASNQTVPEGGVTPETAVNEGQNTVEGQLPETSPETITKPNSEIEEPLYTSGKDKIYSKDVAGLYEAKKRLQSERDQALNLLHKYYDASLTVNNINQKTPDSKQTNPPASDEKIEWQEDFLDGKFDKFKKAAGINNLSLEDIRKTIREENQRIREESERQNRQEKSRTQSEDLNSWRDNYLAEMNRAGNPVPEEVISMAVRRANALLSDPAATADDLKETFEAVVENQMRKRNATNAAALKNNKGTVDRAKMALEQAQVNAGPAGFNADKEKADREILRLLSSTSASIPDNL